MESVHVAPILTACAGFAWTMLGVELVQRDARRTMLAGRALIFAAAGLFAEASWPAHGALPIALLLTAMALNWLRPARAAAAAPIPTPASTAAPTPAADNVSTTAAMRDLRNPLTSMLAAIDAAATREDQHVGMQQLRAYAHQLAAAMTDIDDLENLLHGDLELAHDTYDLQKVLGNCIDEMAPLSIERDVQLRYDPSSSLPRWNVGDPSRVRQLFSRVLQLATDRCTIGPVDISASADEHHVHLVLLNVHAGLEDPDSLGVTLANGLAKVMGGGLQLRARADGGTEFHVQLPLVTAPAWEVELLNEDAETECGSTLRRHRVQGAVLLVTDQPDHQQLFSELLADTGAEATVAATADLALHLLCERSFDLVLLDMESDANRGVRTMRELRERTADTPVLGLTSDRSATFHEQCLLAGCNGVLHKPIDVQMLRGALAMHLAAAN